MHAQKTKIAILGSAVDESETSQRQAQVLGEALGKIGDKIILLNGACPGMPDRVIRAAKISNQIEVWGYSSSINKVEQRKDHPEVDLANFSKIIYIRHDTFI